MDKNLPLQKNEDIQLGRRGGGTDLDGYIFTDLEHARKWLSQLFVKPESYFVKYVMPKPKEKICHACGTHHTMQDGVYSVRRELEVGDFLSETAPSKAIISGKEG